MSFLPQGEKPKKEKRIYDKKFKINFSGIIEGFLLIGIVVTCVTVEFVTIPIFLSVIFLLIQIKKYVNHLISRMTNKEVVK